MTATYEAIPEHYHQIIADYVVALRAGFADVGVWWNALLEAEAASGRGPADAMHRLRMRWPLAEASHPRIIGVFTSHFDIAEQENQRILDRDDRPEADFDFRSERAWYDDDEDDENNPDALMRPADLLLSTLEDVAPDLAPKMQSFLFIPVRIDIPWDELRAGPRRADSDPKIFHNIDMGHKRLMVQPSDVVGRNEPATGLADASTHHNDAAHLFSSYTKDLALVCDTATSWWNDLVERSERECSSEKDAIRLNYERRPAGPASHPFVTSCLRDYWIAFIQHRSRKPGAELWTPETVMLHDLERAGFAREHKILSAMPYWPIGLDENGNWC